jgi:type VI secretion system secreted protein VgrG
VQQQRQAFFDSQKERKFSQQLRVDDALHKHSGSSAPATYRFIDETGTLIGAGTLDLAGQTLRAFTDSPQKIKAVVDLNEGQWTALTYRNPFEFHNDTLDDPHVAVFDYEDHDASDSEPLEASVASMSIDKDNS